MTTLTAKITKRAVDALEIPTTGETRLWDTEVKGFHIRAHPTGRKVYALRYRRGTVQRTLTIGRHGSPWTPDLAREEAVQIIARVASGLDPAADKRAERKASTVSALIDIYLEDGPATKPAKRARTWLDDASNLKRHIKPLLGSRLASDVTKSDAAKAIRDITEGRTAKTEKTKKRGVARVTGGPGVARRTRITAAAMYAWGIEHGLVTNNPFAGVRLTAAPVKERFLSPSEMKSLWTAVGELEATKGINPTFADAIRLLLLTGARKTEILGLKWSEVALGRRVLTLPPERTKAGGKTGERRIRLSSEASTILARRHGASDGDLVFPASGAAGHAVGLRRPFKRACDLAGLPDVRVHDLRHSYASALLASGHSLPLIAQALGHAGTRTTERYAHLADDPLQAAASEVADLVFGQTRTANAA